MSEINRMVRITIEQMTEPADVHLAEIEAEHVIEVDDVDGAVLDSFAIVNGVRLPIPCGAADMDRFYAMEASHV